LFIAPPGASCHTPTRLKGYRLVAGIQRYSVEIARPMFRPMPLGAIPLAKSSQPDRRTSPTADYRKINLIIRLRELHPKNTLRGLKSADLVCRLSLVTMLW
jgi:hypothetical protein